MRQQSSQFQFELYEERVLNEIARQFIEPRFFQRAISFIGKPVHRIYETAQNSNVKALRFAASGVQGAIIKAQLQTIKIAQNFKPEQAIMGACSQIGISLQNSSQLSQLPLEKKDQLADCFVGHNSILIGFEGAVLGLATSLASFVPFAQVSLPGFITTDIILSMTLLARHVIQVATSYGFPGNYPQNIPHILAAMAPEKEATDEGYLSSKAIIINAIRESGEFLAEFSGKELTQTLIRERAPRLIKLMQYLAERLGLILTEKQLSMGIPVAGAFLNGGINYAFQQYGHATAKNYFRRLLLEEKYGMEPIQKAIQIKINEFSKNRNSGDFAAGSI